MSFEGALQENHDFFRQKKRARARGQQAQCIQRHKSILLGNLRALKEWQKVGIGSLRARLSRVFVVQLNSLDCLPQVGVEEPSEVFSRVFDFESDALAQAAVTAVKKKRHITEAGKTESTHIVSCACHSWT